MPRSTFYLGDGTVAYIRPENEFRKKITGKEPQIYNMRDLSSILPDYRDSGSKRFYRVQGWVNLRNGNNDAGRRFRILIGLDPDTDGSYKATIKRSSESQGKSNYIYYSIKPELKKGEDKELKMLMINALDADLTTAYYGSKSFDQSIEPFERKLNTSSPATLQKWGVYGGFHYSVVTPKLDEIRCIGSGGPVSGVSGPTYGQKIRDEARLVNDDDLLRNQQELDLNRKKSLKRMAHHARRPFAMDEHLGDADYMGKHFDKKEIRYIDLTRKIIESAEKKIRFESDEEGSKYKMFKDVNNMIQELNTQRTRKEDFKITTEPSGFLFKNEGIINFYDANKREDSGGLELSIRNFTAGDVPDYIDFLKEYGVPLILKKMRSGPDKLVAARLFHLEQFIHKFGIITSNPESNTIGNKDKCVDMLNRKTTSELKTSWAEMRNMLKKFKKEVNDLLESYNPTSAGDISNRIKEWTKIVKKRIDLYSQEKIDEIVGKLNLLDRLITQRPREYVRALEAITI